MYDIYVNQKACIFYDAPLSEIGQNRVELKWLEKWPKVAFASAFADYVSVLRMCVASCAV